MSDFSYKTVAGFANAPIPIWHWHITLSFPNTHYQPKADLAHLTLFLCSSWITSGPVCYRGGVLKSKDPSDIWPVEIRKKKGGGKELQKLGGMVLKSSYHSSPNFFFAFRWLGHKLSTIFSTLREPGERVIESSSDSWLMSSSSTMSWYSSL